MPHSRILKPQFFDNAKLGGLDSDTRLLYAGLWCLADREGIIEYQPAEIRRFVFGYRDNITEGMIHNYITVLSRLDNGKLLLLKEYDSKIYIVLVDFKLDCNPHHTEKKGKLPTLETLVNKEIYGENVTSQLDNGYLTGLTITVPITVTVKEGENAGAQEELKNLPPVTLLEQSVLSAQFADFWTRYGPFGNRHRAFEEFENIKGVDYEKIKSGIERYQAKCRADGTTGKFITHASNWLAARGWEDEYPIVTAVSKPTKKGDAALTAALSGLESARKFNGN